MAKKKRRAARGPASAAGPVETREEAPPSTADGGTAEGGEAPRSGDARPGVPAWLTYLLAALGGTLYFLGFAGFDVWPAAFVCYVPLLFALESELARGARTRRLLGLGYVFGVVQHAGGYYWLVGFLDTFSGFPMAANLFFAAVFWSWGALQTVTLAWLYGRMRRADFGVVPAFLAVVAAVELAFPLLFPSYLANSFHDVPALMQVADLGGPILVSLVGVAVNLGVYEGLRAMVHRERPARLAPALGVAALGLSLLYGAARIAEVDARVADAAKLTVGLVQTNMGIFSKREDPWEGQRRHVQDTVALEAEVPDLDLVVWPESAYTFFLPPGTRNVKRLVMGRVSTPLLFGGLARREQRAFNTAYLTSSEGDILGTYDKTYLLAFGEYLPFGETFPVLYEWSPNSGHFTPGDHVRPLPFRDFRLSTLICYEDVLPGFTRTAVAEADPHLLVNITNDAWFGDTNEPWIHLALAKLRAVEHHRFLVRATNSGVSAIVDPVGRVVAHTGVMTRERLHATVAMLDDGTVFGTLGSWPGWVGLGATVLFAFVAPWRRRRGAAG